MVIILNDESKDISLITIDVNTWPEKYFFYYSLWFNHGGK